MTHDNHDSAEPFVEFEDLRRVRSTHDDTPSEPLASRLARAGLDERGYDIDRDLPVRHERRQAGQSSKGFRGFFERRATAAGYWPRKD